MRRLRWLFTFEILKMSGILVFSLQGRWDPPIIIQFSFVTTHAYSSQLEIDHGIFSNARETGQLLDEIDKLVTTHI